MHSVPCPLLKKSTGSGAVWARPEGPRAAGPAITMHGGAASAPPWDVRPRSPHQLPGLPTRSPALGHRHDEKSRTQGPSLPLSPSLSRPGSGPSRCRRGPSSSGGHGCLSPMGDHPLRDPCPHGLVAGVGDKAVRGMGDTVPWGTVLCGSHPSSQNQNKPESPQRPWASPPACRSFECCADAELRDCQARVWLISCGSHAVPTGATRPTCQPQGRGAPAAPRAATLVLFWFLLFSVSGFLISSYFPVCRWPAYCHLEFSPVRAWVPRVEHGVSGQPNRKNLGC